MKNLFNILILLTLFVGLPQSSQAQGIVWGSVQADGTLFAFGDEDRGMDAGTIDVLFKVKLTGNQSEVGYLYVAPTFEYAQLPIQEYYRWQGEVGYTFNQWFLENLETSIYASYGAIHRGMTTMSFGFGGTLGYKLGDNFKLVADLQFVDRTDFITIYNLPSKIKYSVLVGVEVNIFDTNKRASNRAWRR